MVPRIATPNELANTMSNRLHRIPVFSSNGHFVIRHLPLRSILSQVDEGIIVPFQTRAGSQWRMAEGESKKPEPPSSPSPSTITWMETRAYVGEFGPRAQKIAAGKINAWANTHDDRATTICAGKVITPATRSPR